MKRRVSTLLIALLLPLGLFAADTPKTEKKKESCAHEKAPAAKTGHACKAEEKSDVILVGKLLCEHCNLHRKESCSPVFAAEGRDGEIPVCPETKDLEKIKTMGEHGTVTLEVKGTLCKAQDGQQELMIVSYSKKA